MLSQIHIPAETRKAHPAFNPSQRRVNHCTIGRLFKSAINDSPTLAQKLANNSCTLISPDNALLMFSNPLAMSSKKPFKGRMTIADKAPNKAVITSKSGFNTATIASAAVTRTPKFALIRPRKVFRFLFDLLSPPAPPAPPPALTLVAFFKSPLSAMNFSFTGNSIIFF